MLASLDDILEALSTPRTEVDAHQYLSRDAPTPLRHGQVQHHEQVPLKVAPRTEVRAQTVRFQEPTPDKGKLGEF